jgi:subtilisin family serine protease
MSGSGQRDSFMPLRRARTWIIVWAAVALGLASDASAQKYNPDSYKPPAHRQPPREWPPHFYHQEAGVSVWSRQHSGIEVPGTVLPGISVTLPRQPTLSETSGGDDGFKPPTYPTRHRYMPKLQPARPIASAKTIEPRAHAPAPARPPPPSIAANLHPPPPAETRFRLDEILISTSPTLGPAAIARIVRRHRLIEIEFAPISLTDVSLRVWRIPDGRAVAEVVQELAGETLLSVQPNYVYTLEDGAQSPSAAPLDEYWLAKVNVDPALDIAAGNPVRVAVIDTAIDETHPDLDGAVEARFDAVDHGHPPRTLGHGTSIAGAIAGRGRIRGVSPSVRILAARAFDSDGSDQPISSTFSVAQAIDWAAQSGAQIINMSFAGPADPAVHAALAVAASKGMMLVGAVGNAGPKSAPLYPGADENVVAVSATDSDDAVYPLTNAGGYIAFAAPGVDVLLPAPNGGYAMETGTSVSAALVSGVVALLLERRPEASPQEIRAWLQKTARPIKNAGRDRVGAGLVDAGRALSAAAGKGDVSRPAAQAF